MHSTVGSIGRLCIIHWQGRPSAADVKRVANEVMDARRAAGRPLILVAYAAPSLELAEPQARLELMRLTPLVDRACEAQYIVVDGTDLKRRVLRGFVTAVLSIMRAPATVLDSVSDAVAQAGARAELDPGEVLAAAQAQGVLPA